MAWTNETKPASPSWSNKSKPSVTATVSYNSSSVTYSSSSVQYSGGGGSGIWTNKTKPT